MYQTSLSRCRRVYPGNWPVSFGFVVADFFIMITGYLWTSPLFFLLIHCTGSCPSPAEMYSFMRCILSLFSCISHAAGSLPDLFVSFPCGPFLLSTPRLLFRLLFRLLSCRKIFLFLLLWLLLYLKAVKPFGLPLRSRPHLSPLCLHQVSGLLARWLRYDVSTRAHSFMFGRHEQMGIK